MAYDEFLADRISGILDANHISYEKKEMMGGLTFMVNKKMCIGVVKENLMARIDPEVYKMALKKPGCVEMNFTGRPMKGYVFVEPEGTDMETDLEYWIQLCLEYNPMGN
ncbi:MAG: TfoX/Sxy family protein [Bacteroidota bacterium]|nr:TfoX/Sxy family protein [Bacteroidota bacterium]